jgi:hypothetical protein
MYPSNLSLSQPTHSTNAKTYAQIVGNIKTNNNFHDLFTVTECIQIMTEISFPEL